MIYFLFLKTNLVNVVGVSEELEKRIRVLAENGLSISRVKTKCMMSIHCQDEIYLLNQWSPTVDSFNVFGSTIQAERGCEKDVTNMIRAGWNRWREMFGVVCDKKAPEVLKYNIYKTAIRPAMTYCGECCAIRKCGQNQMNTTEMKMLRRIQGKTRKYHIRNVIIREKAHIDQYRYFPREETTVMVRSCAAEK